MGSEQARDLRDEFADRLHEHQRIVSKIAAVYAARREDREDLTQEIVTQLWRAYPSFRGESSFSTWAYRVALNTALLRRRRATTIRRSGEVLGQEAVDAAPAPDGPDPAETNEGIRLLHACIRTLRAVERGIVLLHLEGHPHAEIASILGISANNVGVRLHRIKNTLRECLTARGYVEEPVP